MASKVTSAQDTLTRIANVKPGKKIRITGMRGTERFDERSAGQRAPRPRASQALRATTENAGRRAGVRELIADYCRQTTTLAA